MKITEKKRKGIKEMKDDVLLVQRIPLAPLFGVTQIGEGNRHSGVLSE